LGRWRENTGQTTNNHLEEESREKAKEDGIAVIGAQQRLPETEIGGVHF